MWSDAFTKFQRSTIHQLILKMITRKRSYGGRTATQMYQPARKRRYSVAGLRPTFRGFYPRGFSQGEWKYKDVIVNADINSTATLTLLNGIAPGTGAQERIGMKITVRSIQMSLRFTTTPATGVDQYCRVFLVMDRQCNGAVIGAPTDILAAGNVSGLRNLANRKRFKIMWDKLVPMGGNLNAAGTPSTLPNMRIVKMYMKLRRPLVIEYNTGIAGTVADISTNSLYLVTLGTEAAGNTDVNMVGYARIRYVDM